MWCGGHRITEEELHIQKLYRSSRLFLVKLWFLKSARNVTKKSCEHFIAYSTICAYGSWGFAMARIVFFMRGIKNLAEARGVKHFPILFLKLFNWFQKYLLQYPETSTCMHVHILRYLMVI